MKLRIRYNRSTKVVELENAGVKIGRLKDIIVTNIPNLGKEFQLSLNGRDSLQGGDEKELSAFDIVPGDLIHVLCDSTGNNSKSGQNAANMCDTSQPSFAGINTSKECVGKCPRLAEDEQCCSIESNRSEMDVACVEDVQRKNVCTEDIQSDTEVLETSIKLDKPRSMEELIEIQVYLNEPMLCREATETAVPNRLIEVFNNSCVASKSEALCAVLHVLMLETGFSASPSFNCQRGCHLPDGWRCPGSYKLTYVHPACKDSSCNLVLVPLGSQMTVHGSICGGEAQSPCKSQFKEQDYIGSVDQDVPKVYYNLAKLSRVFKDAVALPLLHKIHSATGSCVPQGFTGMSNEVKLIILRYLDVGSLLKVSEVSKALNELTKDPWLWRRNYLLYWPKKANNSLNQNWYEIYKLEYKRRKELRERLKRMTPVITSHPFFPRIHPTAFPPPPPAFGGIMGGEYDLNPNFGFPDPVFPGTGRRIMPERQPQLLQPRFDPMGPDPDMNLCIPQNQSRGLPSGPRYTGVRPFFGWGMNPRFL